MLTMNKLTMKMRLFAAFLLLGLWLLLTWLVFTVRRQCAGGKPAVLPVQFGIRQQQLLQGIRFRQAVIIHNPQILCPGTRCLLDAAGKAALRQQVARELYAQRCAQAKALARRELIFQLGGCVKGTLPKDLVSGNYFAEQRNFNLRLQANNVNFDQYLKVRGQTVEQFRTELHAQAEQKLRGSLGLLMVAEREHLWPTDAEVEAALAHWKGERTFPANDFRKVRQGIASQRAAEFVEAHSTLLPPPEEPVLETIA